MLIKCLILFLSTIPLIIISDRINEHFNSYNFKFGKRITERKKYGLVERVAGFVFALSVMVMIMTVISGTYIYIFL